MSKCKNQGLGKVMCGLSIGLLLSTTPLIAMEDNHNEKEKSSRKVKERTDPNERPTISNRENPQLPPVTNSDSSFSEELRFDFVDMRGD